MRFASLAIVIASLACATPAEVAGLRADLDRLREKQRIDNEELARKIADEVGQLGDDLRTIRAAHEELTTRVDGLGRKPMRRSRPDPTKTYAIPVDDSPTKGADDAWVTIVEIAEYQCPYCVRVQPTLKALSKTYGRDVRIVFKHNPLPFHANAMPAAIASSCAHQQRSFWPLHEILFDNSRALGDDQLIEYARQVGNLNFQKWKRCIDEREGKGAVIRDQKVAANFGARGTPVFFINGRFLSGAQPQAAFETLIDEELSKAKASGVARGDYYETVVVGAGAKKL